MREMPRIFDRKAGNQKHCQAEPEQRKDVRQIHLQVVDCVASVSTTILSRHIPAQYMNQSDIGLIGLAVMGENLVLNMESRGFRVGVFNRTTAVTEKFDAGRGKGKNFVFDQDARRNSWQSLKRPRKAQIMVKAGAPVDAVIDQLVPLLEPGDIIIDGGNSLWTDTQRREKALKEKGIHFFGVGVSGGEEGALKGPSIMPGGSKEGWQALAPIYTKIAAVAEGEPCCRHMGPDGAGHYVKMVHNGIEYGDMQLICEAYAILQGRRQSERGGVCARSSASGTRASSTAS